MQQLKILIVSFLMATRLHRLFRTINRERLLVVMYHGVTRADYDPPIWTQLPEDKFCQQLEFLQENYSMLRISELISMIDGRKEIPRNSAILTFDDGLRNNYDVVFPQLKRLSIPATVFLTVDLIDTREMLWVDELYFIISTATEKNIKLVDAEAMVKECLCREKIWHNYLTIVNIMKGMPEPGRNLLMQKLRAAVAIKKDDLLHDFGFLKTEQILEMQDSGLVDFGSHTANHRILTGLAEHEWDNEIKASRAKLSNIIGREVKSFCYPNGRPGIDFNEAHVAYLKKCGYSCAFTTEPRLYNLNRANVFEIGRIPAGNDFTSDLSFFKLNTSGLFECFNRRKMRVRD